MDDKFNRLIRATNTKIDPIIDILVNRNPWDVAVADAVFFTQAPDLKEYPSFQSVQTNVLELDHIWQFSAWQLDTVSLTSFCIEFITPDTVEIT